MLSPLLRSVHVRDTLFGSSTNYVLDPFDFFKIAIKHIIKLIFDCPDLYASYLLDELEDKALEIFFKTFHNIEQSGCCADFLLSFFPGAHIEPLVMLFQQHPSFANTQAFTGFVCRVDYDFIKDELLHYFTKNSDPLPFMRHVVSRYRKLKMNVFSAYQVVGKQYPQLTETASLMNLGLLKLNFEYLTKDYPLIKARSESFCARYEYIYKGLLLQQQIQSKITQSNRDEIVPAVTY